MDGELEVEEAPPVTPQCQPMLGSCRPRDEDEDDIISRVSRWIDGRGCMGKAPERGNGSGWYQGESSRPRGSAYKGRCRPITATWNNTVALQHRERQQLWVTMDDLQNSKIEITHLPYSDAILIIPQAEIPIHIAKHPSVESTRSTDIIVVQPQ